MVNDEGRLRQPTTAKCRTCQRTKPLEDFPLHRGNRNGRGANCLKCLRSGPVASDMTVQREAQHWRSVKFKYGMTKAQYEELLQHQGGGCAICGRAGNPYLDIDHDHDSGIVRGLLCEVCNRSGLPSFRNDRRLLAKAIKYLAEPPAHVVLARLPLDTAM